MAFSHVFVLQSQSFLEALVDFGDLSVYVVLSVRVIIKN